jgi:hypothetical protein
VEQRANVLFHVKDDLAVLEVWQRLRADEANSTTLDAFAYRRAAISAARLGRWDEAEDLFLAGASAASSLSTEPTRFGLMGEAALARSSARIFTGAAQMLVNAVAILPDEAAEEGNVRWEATLRVTSDVCRTVETRALGTHGRDEKVVPGWASSPNLTLGKHIRRIPEDSGLLGTGAELSEVEFEEGTRIFRVIICRLAALKNQ